MIRKKLFLYVSVALLTLFALVGCSSNTSSNSKTTLSVWAMGEEGKRLEQLVEGFEKEYSDINVEVQPIPWDSAHDKLLTAVASGKGPDVLQLGTSWMPEFANAGALLDLTSYTEEYPNFNKENYFNGAVESMLYDDKIIGVPWYVETRVLFYRTDLLAEVGYDKAPATWDELKDAARKLTDRGDEFYGIDIPQNDAIMPFMFAWQNGSDFIDAKGNMNFESEEFVGGIEFFNSFFEEGLTPTTKGMDIIQAFKDGIKPMFISGPWMVNILNEQTPDLEGKWAVAELPVKETNTSYMGGSNFTVFHNTKHVEESLKFISYMTEVDTQLEWLDISNTLPSRIAAWDDPVFEENPMLATFGDQMESTKASPQVEQWSKISQQMLKNLEKVIIGGSNLETELESFRSEVDKILAD